MSEAVGELDDLVPQRRDDDAGESFMLTFAAVGGLVLLEMDAAEASVPTSPQPVIIDEAQELLRGPTAPAPADALGAPAATDSAFLAAIAALSPPSDDAPIQLTAPSTGATHDFAAARTSSVLQSLVSDDAIGASTAPNEFATFGPGGRVVYGDNLSLALGAGATLTIGGDNDLVLASANDTVNVLAGSSVAIVGDGAKVNLASGDTISLNGAGFEVRSNGTDNVVALRRDAQATVYGDGVAAHLEAPGAKVTMIGDGNKIVSAAAGATVAVAGGGAAANSVDLTAGDVVNLLDLSKLAAHGAGAAYLGANDYLSLFGSYEVFAPEITGASVIASFSAADTLHLHSHYADFASLLGAATQAHGATTLHLDSSGDTLSLVGIGKAGISALAASNHITLY